MYPVTFLTRTLSALSLVLLLQRQATAQQPALLSLPMVPTPPASSAQQPAADLYHIKEITIDDRRPSVSDRPIKLPIISKPGQTDKVWPALTADQQSQIRKHLQEHFTSAATKPAATLHCRILDAYQLFSASWNSENIETLVRLELELRDAQGQPLMVATGEQHLFQRSIDAKYKVVDQLYSLAWSGAVLSGLRYLALPAPTK